MDERYTHMWLFPLSNIFNTTLLCFYKKSIKLIKVDKYQNTCVGRDWMTPSKYDDTYYILINQYVLGDQYDHFIRKMPNAISGVNDLK